MKKFAKTALVAVLLVVSAGLGFAADVKAPAPYAKGAAQSAVEGVTADVKASAVAGKDAAKAKAADVKAAAKVKLIDINTATEAELKAVSGIGDAYAAKIIAGRPYASKTQLKSRKVVPAVLYEQVKDQLIAKQPKK